MNQELKPIFILKRPKLKEDKNNQQENLQKKTRACRWSCPNSHVQIKKVIILPQMRKYAGLNKDYSFYYPKWSTLLLK